MKLKEWHIILGLLLLQLLLCVPVLELFPIALDEPFTFFHAQLPLSDLLTEIGKGNNSPLHFVLLHFWIEWFGNSPFAIRMLSVLFSLILIAVLYLLARKITNRTISILIAGFFIFSRLNHYIAMEARMYGLFTLLFLLILYYLYGFIFEQKKSIFQLAIFNALLLYTHYLGAIIIVMEIGAVVVFYKHLSKKKWIEMGATFLLGGLLFVPGILFFFSRVDAFTSNGTWVPTTNFVDLWVNLIKFFNNEFAFFTTIGILVLLVFFKFKSREKVIAEKGIVFWSYWFFGLYLLFFLISLLLQPIFIIRYLQFLTIPLYLLLGQIFSIYYPKELNRNWVFLLVIPLGLSFKIIPETNRETDVLIRYVQELKTKEAVVYFCPPHYNYTIAYHLGEGSMESPFDLMHRIRNKGYYGIYNAAEIDFSASAIVFIDFEGEFLYPNNEILETLDQKMSYLSSRAFEGNFNVYHYEQRK